MTWLQRIGKNNLKPLYLCKNLKEAAQDYDNIQTGNFKIVLTGTGRVSSGCVEILDMMNIRNVTPDEFLHEQFDEPVYTQLNNSHMYYKSGESVFNNMDYHNHPEQYKSKFWPYTQVADVFINGIYWDKRIPAFFTKEEMKDEKFKIKVIADITCDIAPVASVPSTLRASTILAPVYGYNPRKERECEAFKSYSVDVMAVDNLPNELPRDASKNFGELFIERIIPALLKDQDEMIDRATIANKGKLTSHFSYLSDYIQGN
jgi:hypothetical protein